MTLFLLRSLDVADSADRRAAFRADHLAHIRGSGRTRIGGPIYDAGGAVTGSFVVVEAEDEADARAFWTADPFQQAGIYRDVEIHAVGLTYLDLQKEGA